MGVRFSVKKVDGAAEFKRFVDLPFSIYKDNPYWVAPLRRDVIHTLSPKKNAFFEHGKMQLFLAQDEAGNVIGRIAAIVNGMHLKKYNDGIGFFGFFESVDQPEVAHALLDAASSWLNARGLTGMRGPANPSLNDVSGLLVEGFDREPSILMPYNPPYYEALFTSYGLERVMTMWAYYLHKKYVHIEKLRRGVEIVKRRTPGLRLRNLDMKRFDEDARAILHIYNDGWGDNWGHVPMTENEFTRLAKDLKQIADPSIVFILEHMGEPVAFSVSLPNLNLALRHVRNGRLFPFGLAQLLARAKFGGIYECRMPLMGVLKKYHGRGFDSIVVLATIENGPRNGYDACEMSWVLDTNHVLRNSLVSMGGVIDKQYALYEKSLSAG